VSDLKELDAFVKQYGKKGMRLLVIFSLLKSKAKASLQPFARVDEGRLDRVCMAKAKELLDLGKDQPTEEDIKELLARLR